MFSIFMSVLLNGVSQIPKFLTEPSFDVLSVSVWLMMDCHHFLFRSTSLIMSTSKNFLDVQDVLVSSSGPSTVTESTPAKPPQRWRANVQLTRLTATSVAPADSRNVLRAPWTRMQCSMREGQGNPRWPRKDSWLHQASVFLTTSHCSQAVTHCSVLVHCFPRAWWALVTLPCHHCHHPLCLVSSTPHSHHSPLHSTASSPQWTETGTCGAWEEQSLCHHCRLLSSLLQCFTLSYQHSPPLGRLSRKLLPDCSSWQWGGPSVWLHSKLCHQEIRWEQQRFEGICANNHIPRCCSCKSVGKTCFCCTCVSGQWPGTSLTFSTPEQRPCHQPLRLRSELS